MTARMPQNSEMIRIAVIVDREGASCLPLYLPFSVVGYPLVQVEFFKASAPAKAEPVCRSFPECRPEAVALGLHQDEVFEPVRPLTELQPQDFDLVLDWQNWSADLPDRPPEGSANLVTGPGTPVLEQLLCQFQELRQKIEISAGILLNATDAIVTINENHVIVGYNQGAEYIFGYSREEALGQNLDIIIPPPHKGVHKEYVRRYVATREPHVIGKHVQLNAQRRNGTEFPMSISFSVAEIRGNLYFTGIVRDITEYKEMENRLVQSERLAAVGNTVSHIAHEIKNPLAIIGGFARQLQKAGEWGDKEKHKLGIIAEEVARLEEMIAEMRDFVRRPPAKKQMGDLEAILDETLTLFQDTFEQHRITVHWLRQQALPRLAFDPQQIHQVFLNLFKNALEAMPRGGELTVATRVQQGRAEIAVSDTGEGMTPEVQAKIFQPYFTTKERGTGVGLAICRNIMEEHGGVIAVESIPGQGSSFILAFPLEEASAA
jgi:two-component system, LuxR family, sensor kinase FixL